MKPKSISGIVYYVKDTATSAEYYKKLGFRPGKEEDGVVTVYLNWFWLELRPAAQAVDNSKLGSRTYISVEDVDACYKEATEQGLACEGEPSDERGRRELVVTDPDGYVLVFFKKSSL